MALLVLFGDLIFFYKFSLDGRHFKSVYGKGLVDFLVTSCDQMTSEIERSEGDRLAAHQNTSASLQGQISLIRSHQAVQDRRINFALAREAEEADGRVNDRFVVVHQCSNWVGSLFLSSVTVFG